jgi:ABC-type transporter Mla maintaining outer membrane lipid asymmetry ATPase subunit MlaF
MTAVIETEKLTKSYGVHRGIIEVDLEVQAGEIFGFLRPNGAGKTTTIRTILDLIRPTSGRALVFGFESTRDPVSIHRRIGYLPGEFTLYDRLTGGLAIAFYLLDSLGAALRLPDAILDLSLPRHLGHPMIGVYDPAGILLCIGLAVGGVLLGAWGLQRRDLGT